MRDQLSGILRSPAELMTLGVAAAIIAATVITAGGNGTPDAAVTAQGATATRDEGLVGAYVSGRSSARAALPGATTRANEARRASSDDTTKNRDVETAHGTAATEASPFSQWVTSPAAAVPTSVSASPSVQGTNGSTTSSPTGTPPGTPSVPPTTPPVPVPTVEPTEEPGGTTPSPSPSLGWTPEPTPPGSTDGTGTSGPGDEVETKSDPSETTLGATG